MGNTITADLHQIRIERRGDVEKRQHKWCKVSGRTVWGRLEQGTVLTVC